MGCLGTVKGCDSEVVASVASRAVRVFSSLYLVRIAKSEGYRDNLLSGERQLCSVEDDCRTVYGPALL